MNDLQVSEFCSRIKTLSRKLDELQAKGPEMELFMALSNIQRAAEQAQWRMNDLIYGRGFNPEELMGQ